MTSVRSLAHTSQGWMAFWNLILKNKRIFLCFEGKDVLSGPGSEEILGLFHVRHGLLKSCLNSQVIVSTDALVWTTCY